MFRFNLQDGLRVAAGALGVAGVMALIGYLAEVAHQDMLGIRIGFTGATDLAFTAGGFLLDSLLVTLRQCENPWKIMGLAILIGSVAVVRYKWRRWSDFGLLVLGFFALGGVLVCYELPAIGIQDLLIGDKYCQGVTLESGYIKTRTDGLWTLLARAHEYSDSDGCWQLDAVVASQKWWIPGDSVSAQSRLEALYSLAILVTAGMWVTLLIQGSPSGNLALLRDANVALLATATILLPYVYGKLIAKPEARHAIVFAKNSSEKTPRAAPIAAKEKAPAETADLYGPPSCPPPQCIEAYILAEDDKALFFEHFDTAELFFEWRPKDGIEDYQVQEIVDILKVRIKRHIHPNNRK